LKRKPPPVDDGEGLFNNPFAALKGKLPSREVLPAQPAPEPKAQTAAPAKGPARAVVRLERKGHGGKEVTVVEHLDLPSAELERWLKALKQSLGCGGTLSDTGDALVLQGDQRERLPSWLSARGVRKVTLG